MRCSSRHVPGRCRQVDQLPSGRTPKPCCIMSRATRSAIKRLAQKFLGQSDVRGVVRKQRLWLARKFYRRPVAISELRQQLIDLGVTPGRTLWVQSSWNEFYNVPLRPCEMNDLLRDFHSASRTYEIAAMPVA